MHVPVNLIINSNKGSISKRTIIECYNNGQGNETLELFDLISGNLLNWLSWLQETPQLSDDHFSPDFVNLVAHW